MASFFLMYLKNTSLIKKEIQLYLESEVLCHTLLAKHFEWEPLEEFLEKLLKGALCVCVCVLYLPL